MAAPAAPTDSAPPAAVAIITAGVVSRNGTDRRGGRCLTGTGADGGGVAAGAMLSSGAVCTAAGATDVETVACRQPTGKQGGGAAGHAPKHAIAQQAHTTAPTSSASPTYMSAHTHIAHTQAQTQAHTEARTENTRVHAVYRHLPSDPSSSKHIDPLTAPIS
jgi:hypothetical protein